MKQIILIISFFTCIASSAQTPLYKLLRGSSRALLYDNFTDADATNLADHGMDIGGGWSARQNGLCGSVGNFTVQSNVAQPPGQILSINTADATVSNYVASLTLFVPNQNNYYGGILVRWVDCDDWWAVVIERDAGGTPYLAIIESNAGTRTYRATVNVSGATNSTIRITATLSGNDIIALVNTGETTSYNSSLHASSTVVGLNGYNDGSSYSPAINCDVFLVTN